VARSLELSSAVLLLLAFTAVGWVGAYTGQQLLSVVHFYLSNLTAGEFTAESLRALALPAFAGLGKTVLPVALVMMAGGSLVNFGQVGFLLSVQPLTPDLSKLNPLVGLQRIFSRRALVELVKALVKVLAVGGAIYLALAGRLSDFVKMYDMGLEQAVGLIWQITHGMGLRIGTVLLLLAAFDYWYQRWEHQRNLMMTRQELKEEMKETEGDPQVKASQRKRLRQLAVGRMMEDVKKADVVITNPTHYAVALKYEIGEMEAPRVVAKGRQYTALRIRRTAEENGVAIVEDPPLAQALYASTEVGESIPPRLYRAAAEVLAFVYRLQNRV